MAVTYAVTDIDNPIRLTLDATAGNVTKITCPIDARSVAVSSLLTFSVSGDVKIATSGTDAAAIGSSYFTIPQGTTEVYTLPGVDGRARNLAGAILYIAGTSNSQIVELLFGRA